MKPYLHITLLYGLCGATWIFVSDQMLELLSFDARVLTFLQTLKGWLYVALSSALIFWLTRAAFRRQARAEAERVAIFRKTLEGSQHILRNYLNQMQLVTLEAQRHPGFDSATLQVAEQITEEAAAALEKLQQLEVISEQDIHAAVYDFPKGN